MLPLPSKQTLLKVINCSDTLRQSLLHLSNQRLRDQLLGGTNSDAIHLSRKG